MRITIVLAFLWIMPVKSYCSEPEVFERNKLSLEFSPVSFKAWGSTPSTVTFQIQYKWLMLGYYHINGHYLDELQSPTRSHTIGAFYKPEIPIGEIITISPIVGVFNHRFPTENSAWWAFGLNINCNVTKNVGLYVQHLSNAKTATINPGLDIIGIKYIF